MESLEGMTCGVDGHEWDCLCDVKISQEIPINRIAVAGLWMGQEVADANGYENWDDPQEILDYLCDVLFLYDCHHFQSVYCQDNPATMTPYRGATVIHPYRVIRVNVTDAMRQPGSKIRDVLDGFGYSAHQFTMAASSGHWTMTMEQVEEFEQAISVPDYSYTVLAERFGLDRGGIKRFRTFWPNAPEPIIRKGAGNYPHNIRMRALIADGVRPSDIIDTIRREFDVTITKSAVSQMKRRYKLG